MIVIGLTGGVGMGKSTASSMLRRMRVPVHDADATVHRLMAKRGAAVAAVAKEFPEACRDGAIDRVRLGRLVFGDSAALNRLEHILHPLVRRDQLRFLKRQRAARAALAVLDIPLLYETGAAQRCDAVIVVTAPAFLQRCRVLARPGMSDARLAAILARQVPDYLRRREADFVVPSGLGKAVTFHRLRRIVAALRSRESC
jgi:dephospho-CoA kinase